MCTFTKYQERGAYHWRAIYYRNFLKSNPSISARYDVALRLVSHYLNVKEPLGADIGCGDGILVYKALLKKLRIVGIDLSMDGLVLANQELADHGFESPSVICADGYAVPLAGDSLDYVVSLELIEHLEQPALLLTEVARMLKSGGIFVCTTPRCFSKDNDFRDPFHLEEFTPEELREILSRYFDVVTIKGLHPGWLDQAYKGLTGFKWVDRSLRVAIRILSFFYNPYSLFVYDDVESSSCSTLMGIGYGKHPGTISENVVISSF
jgi:SAM-dependent methyltransferase